MMGCENLSKKGFFNYAGKRIYVEIVFSLFSFFSSIIILEVIIVCLG